MFYNHVIHQTLFYNNSLYLTTFYSILLYLSVLCSSIQYLIYLTKLYDLFVDNGTPVLLHVVLVTWHLKHAICYSTFNNSCFMLSLPFWRFLLLNYSRVSVKTIISDIAEYCVYWILWDQCSSSWGRTTRNTLTQSSQPSSYLVWAWELSNYHVTCLLLFLLFVRQKRMLCLIWFTVNLWM